VTVSDDPGKFSKLFSVLNEAERKQLTSLSKKERFQAGDVICMEGETEADFFVISKGSVTVRADDFGTPKVLATLKSGQFFGELAALGGQPRQATVVADDAVEVIRIPVSAVNEVLKVSPAAKEVLQKAGLMRTEDTLKKMME
jgi:CRP-like cAMP-binding protein